MAAAAHPLLTYYDMCALMRQADSDLNTITQAVEGVVFRLEEATLAPHADALKLYTQLTTQFDDLLPEVTPTPEESKEMISTAERIAFCVQFLEAYKGALLGRGIWNGQGNPNREYLAPSSPYKPIPRIALPVTLIESDAIQ